VLDTAGNELGRHTGLHQFTIGQRKGLGVSSKEPLYVVGFRKETNDVVIGAEADLFKSRCTVSDLNWIVPPRLDEPRTIAAKIRYRATECPVRLHPLLDNRVEVEFETPQRAITPGQALVFYDGSQVLGGGWIEDFPVTG
jgi:tRNA-uridine 2-sulfurtransferase